MDSQQCSWLSKFLIGSECLSSVVYILYVVVVLYLGSKAVRHYLKEMIEEDRGKLL